MFGHSQYRFLISPFILLFLILLAMYFDPATNTSRFVYKGELPDIAVSSVAIVISTFAVGFLISAISGAFLRLLGIWKKSGNLCVLWQEKSKEILNKRYNFEDFHKESEQCEQCIIDIQSTHIKQWMRRRWEYHVTYSNCAWACVLAIPSVYLLEVNWDWRWWIIALFLILVFAFNSFRAWQEVNLMDNFLVRNLTSASQSKKINN